MDKKIILFSTSLLLASQLVMPTVGFAEKINSDTVENGQVDHNTEASTEVVKDPSKKQLITNDILESKKENSTEIAEGVFGTSNWYIDSDMTLHFNQGTLGNTYKKDGYYHSTDVPWFDYLETIKKIVFDGPVEANVDSQFIFSSLPSLITIENIHNLDTSKVTNMTEMFSYCPNLESIDLSNFDTSSVISMTSMFAHSSNLKSIDLSNFDTSSVIDMQNMFEHCSNLKSIDLSNFDTSRVTDMRYMFEQCSSLESIDLSNFDTSRVTSALCMFSGCSDLKSLDLSNFDTSNVQEMTHMFSYCSNLESIDLSNFDTSSVVSMMSMFTGCSNLKSLDLSNFDTSNMINMSDMFSNCSNLEELNISSFNLLNMYNDTLDMFAQDESLNKLIVGPLFRVNLYNVGLPNISMVSPYTGNWILKETGENVGTSDDFMTNYDGTKPGEYVWQEFGITASDYTMYVGDPKPTAYDFNAAATDKEGKEIDVTADLSNVDFSKAGIYKVVLKAADGQTKTVQLTIKDNKQSITGSDFSMFLGDKDATTADFKAAATDKEGKEIDVTADLSNVDFSKAGTYDIVLKAADGQTKTVQLTIKDIVLVPTIEATDKTMYVGDKLTKEDILNWATFKNADGLEQGFTVIGTAIPVSSQDRLTTIGTYKINYYVLEKARDTKESLAQKEITLTVKEKKNSPKNQTDPSNSIDSGTNQNLKGKNNNLQKTSINESVSSMNSAKSLPSTGENSSPVWYVAGIAIAAMASGLFLCLKKTKKR